jgi:hypothetical protein
MAVAPDSLVTPAMWQGEKAPMRARFVAHVLWEQKNRARIELLAFSGRAAGAEGPRSRKLNFASHDSESERGRALGLVIAEMMREFPSSAWIDSTGTTAAAARSAPLHIGIGAMCTAESVGNGVWAVGPAVAYGHGLSEAIWLQSSAAALFASSYNYIQVFFRAGVGWRLLRWDEGRHGVGLGLHVDALRESVSVASDNGSHNSEWNVALVPNLRGHATVWRSLRVAGQVDLRALSSGMSFTYGEDAYRKTVGFDRWRPAFSLGIESSF